MARNATQVKRMNNIGAFLVVILVIASILAIPQIFNTGCNEDCFRKKYKTDETVAKFIGYEMRGSTSTSKYSYNVNGVEYSINESPISNAEQDGDTFNVLYDLADPANAILLRNKPVFPDSLIKMEARISYVSKDKRTNSVVVIFNYYIDNTKIERLQFMPVKYIDAIEAAFKSKSSVDILVYSPNARRSFLDTSSFIPLK